MTNQQYTNAVEAWRKAVEELDQAHAVVRDAGLQHVRTPKGLYLITIKELCGKADDLLGMLETLTCDDCGRPFADHPDVCPEEVQ